MERPRQHEIDTEAQNILKSALPSAWVVNPHTTDYGKDYHVELCEEQQLTGLEFYIQLKGQEHVKFNKDKTHAPFSLERKHAIYYADKVRQPVFLVLVDVNTKIGYWIFVQSYLLDYLKGTDWRKNKTVTTRVPINNLITDTSALRTAIIQAEDYMTPLRPASIEAAVSAHEKRYSSIDPRLKVKISVDGDRKAMSIIPLEEVSLKVKFKNPEKWDNYFGKGQSTSFDFEEVEITGSPLIDELFQPGGIATFDPPKLDGTATLLAKSASGEIISRLDNIPGKLSYGHSECRFEGGFPHSAFSVTMQSKPHKGSKGPLHIRFDVEKWHGQHVRHLAYFDQIAEFLKGAKDAASLGTECYWNGNQLFSGRSEDTDKSDKSLRALKAFATYTLVMDKARKICELVDVNPVLAKIPDEQQQIEIHELHRLLTTGSYRKRIGEGEVIVPFDKEYIPKLIEQIEKDTHDAPLVLISNKSQDMPFLGMEVAVGRLKYEHTHMDIKPTKEELEKRMGEGEQIDVEFISTTTSEQIVERIEGEDVQGAVETQ